MEQDVSRNVKRNVKNKVKTGPEAEGPASRNLKGKTYWTARCRKANKRSTTRSWAKSHSFLQVQDIKM
jgi:hypothetical protein